MATEFKGLIREVKKMYFSVIRLLGFLCSFSFLSDLSSRFQRMNLKIGWKEGRNGGRKEGRKEV